MPMPDFHRCRTLAVGGILLLTISLFPGCSSQTDLKYRFHDSPAGATLLLGAKWRIVFEGVSLSGTDSRGSLMVAGIGQQHGTLKVGEVVFERDYSLGKAVIMIQGRKFEILGGGDTLSYAGQRFESSGENVTELLVHSDGTVTVNSAESK